MRKQFYLKQFSLAYICSLNVKTLLFQAIHFRISTQFSFIWLIDRTLSGATPSQNGPGCDGNAELFRVVLEVPYMILH